MLGSDDEFDDAEPVDRGLTGETTMTPIVAYNTNRKLFDTHHRRLIELTGAVD